MNWTRFILIVVGAGVVTSLTDWLFAGDWLHRRYTYPEIWRQRREESDCYDQSAAISDVRCPSLYHRPVGSSFSSKHRQARSCRWLIGPLPVILTNAAFMKLHRVFVVSYATGWSVKLAIVAVPAGWFL